MDKLIQDLAVGRNGKKLIEALELVKGKIADIRTPLSVKPEIQNEVRLGMIEALDSLLVEKLKVAAEFHEPADNNEHI